MIHLCGQETSGWDRSYANVFRWKADVSHLLGTLSVDYVILGSSFKPSKHLYAIADLIKFYGVRNDKIVENGFPEPFVNTAKWYKNLEFVCSTFKRNRIHISVDSSKLRLLSAEMIERSKVDQPEILCSVGSEQSLNKDYLSGFRLVYVLNPNKIDSSVRDDLKIEPSWTGFYKCSLVSSKNQGI